MHGVPPRAYPARLAAGGALGVRFCIRVARFRLPAEDAAAAIIVRQLPLLRDSLLQRRPAYNPLKTASLTVEPLDGPEPFLIAELGGGDR